MISPILIAMIILICVFLDRVSDRFGIPVLLYSVSFLAPMEWLRFHLTIIPLQSRYVPSP